MIPRRLSDLSGRLADSLHRVGYHPQDIKEAVNRARLHPSPEGNSSIQHLGPQDSSPYSTWDIIVHLVNKTGASALGSPAPVRTRKLSLLSQDHLWSIPDEVYREKLDSDPQLIVDDLNQIRESNYTLDEVMPEVQAALRHRHAPTSSNASDDLGDPSQEQLWLPSPSSVESFNCRHIPGGIVDVYKSIGCSESMDELTSEYEPGSERSRSEEANARMRARVNFFAGPEGPTRKNAPSVSPSADRILASRGFKWTRALDEPSDQFHRAIADGGGSGY